MLALVAISVRAPIFCKAAQSTHKTAYGSSENFTPLKLEKTFNKSRSDYATLDDVYKLLEGDIGSDYRNIFFAALDCYTTDLRDNRNHDNSTADVLPLNEPIIMKDIENTSKAPYTTPRPIYTTPKSENPTDHETFVAASTS